MDPVATVEDLRIAYREGDRWVRVIDGVDLAIRPGEVMGLVGESGCGKSTVGLQLLGYRHQSLRIEGGRVTFRGSDLAEINARDLAGLRGDRIGFVSQNPALALNPSIRVGDQIVETLRIHRKVASLTEGRERAKSLFALVGLPDPKLLVRSMPIRLSPTTTTFRVLPIARVKLGVSGSGDIASNSEQGPEGVERVERQSRARVSWYERNTTAHDRKNHASATALQLRRGPRQPATLPVKLSM